MAVTASLLLGGRSTRAQVIVPPAESNLFAGQVRTTGGTPAVAGLRIEARVGGVSVGRSLVGQILLGYTTTVADGFYGAEPAPQFFVVGDDPFTPQKDGALPGETIEFFVEGLQAQTVDLQGNPITVTFQAGGGFRRVDLLIPFIPPTPTPTVPPTATPTLPPLPVVVKEVTGVLSPSQSLTLLTESVGDPQPLEARLEIPAGAVDRVTEIRVRTFNRDALLGGLTPPDGTLSRVFQLLPEGQQFIEPVTFTIFYDEAELAGIPDENTLFPILFLNGTWVKITQPCDGSTYPCFVGRDTLFNTLTVKTDHFSVWGAQGEVPSTATPTPPLGPTPVLEPIVAFRGIIHLPGAKRPDPEGWRVPVFVKLYSQGEDVLGDLFSNTCQALTRRTEQGAEFDCVVLGFIPGVYDISIYSNSTLTSVIRAVELEKESILIDFGILVVGDADMNGVIDIRDFTLLADSFLVTNRNNNFNPKVDFDFNGVVDITDFTLLALNFFKSSPVIAHLSD